MTLVFLFLVLTIPYVVLTLIGKWIPRLVVAPAKRARVGLSLFFVITSMAHFLGPEAMAEMLPPTVPYRVELIYITGVLELLGAIGVWVPGLTKLTGLLLIVMLAGVLPANIYSAFNRVEYGGHDAGPLYLLVRVPFQLFAMWWTYLATEQGWFSRK